MDLSEAPESMERRHPWEVARLRFFARVVRSLGLGPGPVSLLDVGGGDGWTAAGLLDELPSGSSATSFDPHYRDEDLPRLTRATGGRVRFVRERPADRFSLVLLLDVLEHARDDRGLLRATADNLVSGGTLLVSVPAWPLLFGAHDVDLHHERRYRPAECRALLLSEGLRVVREGGLFPTLLPLRLAELVAERFGRHTPNAGDWRGGALLTRAIGAALDLDATLCLSAARSRLPLPGLSYWAEARR